MMSLISKQMYAIFFTLISGHRTAKITEIVEDMGGLQSYINWSFYVPQPKCHSSYFLPNSVYTHSHTFFL